MNRRILTPKQSFRLHLVHYLHCIYTIRSPFLGKITKTKANDFPYALNDFVYKNQGGHLFYWLTKKTLEEGCLSSNPDSYCCVKNYKLILWVSDIIESK